MAIPIKIQYTIRDAKGFVSRTLVHVPNATTLANATTYAGDLAATIDALIGGKIESIDICIGVALPGGLKSTPDANTDIEEGAVFVYEDADHRVFRQRLPTFLETFIETGTRQVDNSNAGVQAYTDMIVTGNGTTQAVTVSNSDITTLVSDRENFVKNRKGRRL